MATEQNGFKLGSEVAAADLSGSQFRAVRVTSTGINLPAAGGAIDGFLQNKPESGKVCSVAVDGVSKCVASAALAKGAEVSVDATGKVQAAASGHYIVGKLLEASSADGDIVSVLITRPGRLA